MTYQKGRHILSSIVQGLDPITGGDLPVGSVLHNAEVLRALLLGMSALEKEAAREFRRRGGPSNSREPWSDDQDRTLTDAFEIGETLEVIAQRLGRSQRAIEMRLQRLGLQIDQPRIKSRPS
jgi:DNA-binding NarL/FixJ family response regulator